MRLHTSGRRAAVLIDIDRVLCHVNWNPKPSEFNWKEFMKRDLKRTVLMEGVTLAHMMVDQGLFPVFLTARHKGMELQTTAFLREMGFHYGDLVMTSDGDGEEQSQEDYQEAQAAGKLKAMEKLVKKYCFVYAIDDQEANCDVYREFGIATLMARFTEDRT